eukprot:CAMPEP_0173126498 /NCGR_PEP_ID=MMETSP1102-20130122/57160_1 /TAXON_ID=49646 /ORGANISM="Geminigera sp., Strain Caron Lab Isolate" /LENGTH=161 /DNA_ID=CAMNT_0014035793 /DNA_START=156 /DNA_END=637 /DNA_ORIENTATION=+
MNSANKQRRALCGGRHGSRAAAAGAAARDTPEVKVPGQSHYRTPRDALFTAVGACRQGWWLGSGRSLRAGTARLLACACLIAGAHALVPLPVTAQCRDISARTWLLRQSGMSGRSPNAFAGRSLHTKKQAKVKGTTQRHQGETCGRAIRASRAHRTWKTAA